MISLIKGCRVYSPNDIGIKDVLLAGGKIEGIYDNIELKDDLLKNYAYQDYEGDANDKECGQGIIYQALSKEKSGRGRLK